MRKLIQFGLLSALALGVLWSCVELKKNQLYIDRVESKDTIFFASSEIYSDFVTAEAWATDLRRCIQIDAIPQAAYEGELGLHIRWDRTAQGCPWLGIGFGWDNWTGKDLSPIFYTGAVEFYAKMVEGERPMLPWAIGLEDFAGSQAWVGLNSNSLKAEKVTTEWARYEIPISEFDWGDQDANSSDIKQLIIQLEADGEVYIDEIRIVPYSGGYRKRANVDVLSSQDFTIDGETSDAIWNTEPYLFGDNEVHLAMIDGNLAIALKAEDPDPLTNTKTGKDIWDGDCFEIAFSTDLNAVQSRTRYLTTDEHIGFALKSNGVYVYDWENERPITGLETKAVKTSTGYVFEALFDYEKAEISKPDYEKVYGFEMAVDHGNKEARYKQERWNSQQSDRFYLNPALWGEIIVWTNRQTN